MVSIRCEVPVSAWVWSKNRSFDLENFTVKVSNKLIAQASFSSEFNKVTTDLSDPMKSYRRITGIGYKIHSKNKEYFAKSLTSTGLADIIYKDISRVHNRTVEILRASLGKFEFVKLPRINDPRTKLEQFKTGFRRGAQGRYQELSFDLTTFEQLYLSLGSEDILKSASTNERDMEIAYEWFEDNRNVSVSEELIVQAKQARSDDDLRLAVLNYVSTLEQALSIYLKKNIGNMDSVSIADEDIEDFLGPSEYSLKNKVAVLLQIVMHESYLKGIDFKIVKRAIEIRNKIAHGDVLNVRSKYHGTNWSTMFDTLEKLISNLQQATYQIDTIPEIDQIRSSIRDNLELYVSVKAWAYQNHNISVEIEFLPPHGDLRNEIESIVDLIASIRQAQDSRFLKDKHLIINFTDFSSKKSIARFENGQIIQ